MIPWFNGAYFKKASEHLRSSKIFTTSITKIAFMTLIQLTFLWKILSSFNYLNEIQGYRISFQAILMPQAYKRFINCINFAFTAIKVSFQCHIPVICLLSPCSEFWSYYWLHIMSSSNGWPANTKFIMISRLSQQDKISAFTEHILHIQ